MWARVPKAHDLAMSEAYKSQEHSSFFNKRLNRAILTIMETDSNKSAIAI